MLMRSPILLITPLLVFFTNLNPLNFICMIWLILLYMYVFEKKYNYTYILGFFGILYFGLTISTIQYLLQITSIPNITSIYFNTFFSDTIRIKAVLYIDLFNAQFILLTALLSNIIIFYAYNYMKSDLYTNTFIKLLLFFSISMISLLSAGDLFTLILGWELIGIASFLLINFWYTKPTAFKSAIKAFSFNKLSDALLILFILLMLQNDTPLLSFFQNQYLCGDNQILILLAVLGCSFCKSVQFGFHLWLPDSMEAPVPASALIHSATLVSAGLYVSYRFSNLIQLTLMDFSLISSFTACYGSLVAASQTDMKKILAYSTISHCGYLFFMVFYGNTFIFILYLHLHGFFKAIAFILVGFTLQNNSVYQDSRFIASSTRFTNFEFFALPIILMNLAGLPFMFGFFSKFFLLTLLNTYWLSSINLFFIKLGSFGSIVYSVQMIRLVFFDNIKTNFLHLPNIFTKKLNFIYLMIVSLGIVFLLFLAQYINFYTIESPLALLTHNPVFLIVFYKLFALFFIYHLNINSLGVLGLATITLLYVFF